MASACLARAPEELHGLEAGSQWAIHDFFVPSEDLTEAQLLAYRKIITKERPELPQQAGRALHKLQLAMAGKEKPRHGIAPAGDRQHSNIRVRALVRPEIDGDKMAQAFWRLAEQMAEQTDVGSDGNQAEEPDEPEILAASK